jgi:predicted transcriptional regulator
MADGADIHLDPERTERLRIAAEAAGVTPEAFALNAIDQAIGDDWSEALESLEEYERTGVSYPAEEVLAEFRANVEARLAARK